MCTDEHRHKRQNCTILGIGFFMIFAAVLSITYLTYVTTKTFPGYPNRTGALNDSDMEGEENLTLQAKKHSYDVQMFHMKTKMRREITRVYSEGVKNASEGCSSTDGKKCTKADKLTESEEARQEAENAIKNANSAINTRLSSVAW